MGVGGVIARYLDVALHLDGVFLTLRGSASLSVLTESTLNS